MTSFQLRHPRVLFTSCAVFALTLVVAGGAWGYHTHFVK
jgi:hypothetical protein